MYKFPCRMIRALPALALVAVALTAAGAVQAKSVSPCTKVADSCTEWVALGHGSARSMIYTTFRLDVRNPHIRRALIMVHGALRNPDRYFATATAAGFLAGALDDTVIIAPAFSSADGKYCHDHLQPGEVNWREHLGARHTSILIVPECGHNDRCVYTTDDVLKVIFPAESK